MFQVEFKTAYETIRAHGQEEGFKHINPKLWEEMQDILDIMETTDKLAERQELAAYCKSVGLDCTFLHHFAAERVGQ